MAHLCNVGLVNSERNVKTISWHPARAIRSSGYVGDQLAISLVCMDAVAVAITSVYVSFYHDNAHD